MQTSTAISTDPAPENVASDLAGMGAFLIDPDGAAKRVFHKWFWIGPWILMAATAMVSSYLVLPIVQHVLEVAPTPPGADPAAVQKGVEMGLKMGRIGMYVAPITTLALFCIQALVLWGMSSVLSIRGTFRQLLNLVAGCSIIQFLASIAAVIILRTKTDISTMAELRPALGFDIFLPDGSNKYLAAVLGYFSVFEIWWIVMVVLVLAAAFRIDKGKALLAVSPLVVFSLLFRLVGAAFARG